MDKKKIVIFLLVLLVLTPSNSKCSSNDKDLSWSFTEGTIVVAFKEVEHILKWANEPWDSAIGELLSTSDKKNIVVVTKGNGSFIIPTLFYVFLQQDNIYRLYAFSENVVDVTGSLKYDLIDNVLVISDLNGQIGTLTIDFDKVLEDKELLFLDRYIQNDKEHIKADDTPFKGFVKPYFAIKDYDCVVKGMIEERIDLAYFDGGFYYCGGAISAIKVRVLKTFGQKELSEHIWIYPDTSCLGKKPRICNFGYNVTSDPFYFGLIKRSDNYLYRLDDRNFIVIPDEDGSVAGDFYLIDKLTPPNKRILSSEKFEKKLSKRYRHK